MVSTLIMTNIRRYWQDAHTCFMTHVTYKRLPVLVEHFDLFWQAVTKTRERDRFDLLAWVVLPDHCHLLVASGHANPSLFVRKFKLSFSTSLRGRVGQRAGRTWQYRFWDHIIRSQDDLNRHIDYIHYNPVKHGLVIAASDYQYSSFHDYHRDGVYSADWGREAIEFDGEFGE